MPPDGAGEVHLAGTQPWGLSECILQSPLPPARQTPGSGRPLGDEPEATGGNQERITHLYQNGTVCRQHLQPHVCVESAWPPG